MSTAYCDIVDLTKNLTPRKRKLDLDDGGDSGRKVAPRVVDLTWSDDEEDRKLPAKPKHLLKAFNPPSIEIPSDDEDMNPFDVSCAASTEIDSSSLAVAAAVAALAAGSGATSCCSPKIAVHDDHILALALQNQEQEIHDQLKHREEQGMAASRTGKAWKFVEQVLAITCATTDRQVCAVAVDDLVYLAERFLEAQERFAASTPFSRVDIGFHYTRSENLNRIKTDGLMSKQEREASNIQNNYNGSVYGDGIYCAANPFTYSRFGDTGLMVARLKGNERDHPAKFGSDGSINSIVVHRGTPQEFVVLEKSFQCLPLILFPSSTMIPTNNTAGRSNTGMIFDLHVKLQNLVDVFFNTGVPTTVLSWKDPQNCIPVLAGNITGAGTTIAAQEARRRKEKFLMFTRVLMRYLEHKDPNMHSRAKAVIFECAEKNKKKEAGYESVTASMQTRLRKTVGDQYWKRAETYFTHFLNQKKEKVEEAKRQQQKLMKNKQEQERKAARQKIQEIEKQNAELKKVKNKEEANARKRAKAREQQVAKKLAAQQQQQAADRLSKQQREIGAQKATLEASAAQNLSAQTGVRTLAESTASTTRTTSLTPATAAAHVQQEPGSLRGQDSVNYVAPKSLASSVDEVCLVVVQMTHTRLQEECPLCLDTFAHHGRVARLFACGHHFHRSCIEDALKHSSLCPTCRKPATAAARAQQEQEAKRRKEKFLLFARVLVKYLELKDPNMHSRAKAVICECAKNNKNKVAGYESVTASMQTRLRKTVGDQYWKRAETLLTRFLNQKKEKVEEAKRQQQKFMKNKQLEKERKAARQKMQEIEKQNAGLRKVKDKKIGTNAGVASSDGHHAVGVTPSSAAASSSHLLAPQLTAAVGPARRMNSITAMSGFAGGHDSVNYVAPKSLASSVDEVCLVVVQMTHTLLQEECPLCLDTFAHHGRVARLFACGHHFHRSCIEDALKHSSLCPTCRKPTGKLNGKMPSGLMTVTRSLKSCSGYEPAGSIIIEYKISSGQQHDYHPNPGQRHSSAHRTAYLPDTVEGNALLKRLKFAFSHGLTFCIGTSLTTGVSNSVTWSSIHHKTSMSGGPHGFPDANFIENCNAELDSLRVPPEKELVDEQAIEGIGYWLTSSLY